MICYLPIALLDDLDTLSSASCLSGVNYGQIGGKIVATRDSLTTKVGESSQVRKSSLCLDGTLTLLVLAR